jgi:predicted RecA/RadA family phage recombinase
MNMKKLSLFFVLLLILGASQASAFVCTESRIVGQSADYCVSTVTVASNETTLVSIGTVLVYDVANAQVAAANGSYQVRVATASANGIYVAGVAQNTIASGNTGLVVVRGISDLALKTTETIASGNALFVSGSGDATIVTSTTQDQLGFALESSTASGNTRQTKKAYITIV